MMSKTLDQGQIQVNSPTAGYEEEVSRIVGTILITRTGRAIADKIKAHGNVMITDDYGGFDPQEINSDFDPSISSKALGIVRYFPHSRNLSTQHIVLNGHRISWTIKQIHKYAPGQKPDEILCHELVHAARHLGGDANRVPIPSMPEYDNEEEFYAVLLTNIYSSERGRHFESFRKSHRLRYKPEMTKAEEMPYVFLMEDDNYRLIEKFCKQHPAMAPMIALAPCPFNPIRDYYRHTWTRPTQGARPQTYYVTPGQRQ